MVHDGSVAPFPLTVTALVACLPVFAKGIAEVEAVYPWSQARQLIEAI